MMDRRAQGALLLAVAGVALRLGLTDAALAYVKAGLRPLLVAAGVALALIGGATVGTVLRDEARARRAVAAPVAAPSSGAGAGEHADHEPAIGWLLVLPLLALLLIAPPPLGAYAASRQSGRVVESNQLSYPPLPPPSQGAVDLTLAEYSLRALYDGSGTLEGARVRLSGFVVASEDHEGYLLTRFLLSCCAADGIAVQVEIRGDTGVRAPDTWLQIEGRWQPSEQDDPARAHALLIADNIVVIDPPAQPYEY